LPNQPSTANDDVIATVRMDLIIAGASGNRIVEKRPEQDVVQLTAQNGRAQRSGREKLIQRPDSAVGELEMLYACLRVVARHGHHHANTPAVRPGHVEHRTRLGPTGGIGVGKTIPR
jgi:hypothetical protein